MLGAEVIHVESTARPDGTRLLAGLRFSEPDWWERSGIFSGLNTNKKGVTLDLADRARARAAAPAARDLRRRRRELHPAGAGADRARRRRHPRHPPRHRHGAHAGLRARRPVARQPGLRLRDRGRGRAHVDDRLPRPNPVVAVLRRRLRTPALHALCGLLLALEHRRPHRRGRARRGGDGRRRAQRRRRAGRRALGLRRAAGAGRQPGPDRRPAEPLPHRRRRRRRRRDTWVAIAVATDEQWLALRDALGQPDWAMDPALATRRRAARAARRDRRRTSRAGAASRSARRDRRPPLGRGRPGRRR